MVGNDIVDLQFFESPPYRHIHYLDRVCLHSEAAAIRQSEWPVRTLAMVWACKEAAFKLLSRDRGLRHFAPREFVTDFRFSDVADVQCKRRVRFADVHVQVGLSVGDEWVHAIATFADELNLRWRVQRISGSPASALAPRAESEAVRLVAKSLFAALKDDDISSGNRVRVSQCTPDAGQRHGFAVSLSHHGAFVAAAIAWRSGDPGQPEGPRMGEECSTCMA